VSECVCVCVCACWCVCVCVCVCVRGKSYRAIHLRRTHTIPLKFLSPSTCNANVTISLQSTRDCKCTCRLLIRQHIFQTYSLIRRSISPPGTGLETFFTVNGVRVMFHFCLVFKQTRIYIFIFCILCFGGDQNPARVGGSQDTELTILYKQSLQWWFHCI
jgi:hypothetical protein